MSTMTAPPEPGVVEWSLWTTTARLVVTDPSALVPARALVEARLARIEAAASRFRADSEVSRLAELARDPHTPVPISATLADLVGVALDAAARSEGAVDPTLGADLVDLGYGTAPGVAGPTRPLRLRRRTSFRDVALTDDPDRPALVLPPGVLLDLGATAKARAADLCALEVAERFDCGVLVSLGGDLRTAGPPPAEGWGVLVQDGPGEPASRITLLGAQAVATSSTLHRVWSRGSEAMHHLLDPQLRRPVPPVWRTASVAAATCVDANTLTTAAIVRGHAGRDLVERSGAAARLVSATGRVVLLGGWPA